MFKMLKPLLLLVFIADVVLLGVMVHYTSWLFMLGFVFASMFLGGWILNSGVRRYVKKNLKAMKANEMPAESCLLGAVARMAAGMLLIAPGVLSDLLALLLLSPAGKWLTRRFLSSIFTRMLPQCSSDQFDFTSTDKISAKDEIIDVRVTAPDENNNHSERSEESE